MMQQNPHADRKQDKTVEDSFPASDPPANSGITGPGTPAGRSSKDHQTRDSAKRGPDERPTGTPTSDRHATETAHGWEDEQGAANKSGR
jgi:hypothetical protein